MTLSRYGQLFCSEYLVIEIENKTQKNFLNLINSRLYAPMIFTAVSYCITNIFYEINGVISEQQNLFHNRQKKVWKVWKDRSLKPSIVSLKFFQISLTSRPYHLPIYFKEGKEIALTLPPTQMLNDSKFCNKHFCAFFPTAVTSQLFSL